MVVVVVVGAGAVGALADVGALSFAVCRCARHAFDRVLTLLLLLFGVCAGVIGDRGGISGGQHRGSRCVLGLLACDLAAARLRPARVALRARAQALELVDGLSDEGVREGHLWRHARVYLPLDAFLYRTKLTKQHNKYVQSQTHTLFLKRKRINRGNCPLHNRYQTTV